MKETMIKDCIFESCSYNENKKCQASTVNVGDGNHPRCDTFVAGKIKVKGGDSKTAGRVGVCKVKKCSHNVSLRCTAGVIDMGFHEKHPDCLTFYAE
ncbi:MAG: hypothetical protein A2452_12040 [Candidatus Firestonebacteria bacterium RIFOXYC2_FULL_39_67]|nr:MAG: hypothetical protein A2536_00295 [Candidatus Firestonebacteria bacterium RIFOXYD2_FULL_39_29]OGF55697.1 MAG: hypothetical protein A2452_12040 [Candidatus Firestonebacteria bacterium RIFOXYC2_FULL_39_67]